MSVIDHAGWFYIVRLQVLNIMLLGVCLIMLLGGCQEKHVDSKLISPLVRQIYDRVPIRFQKYFCCNSSLEDEDRSTDFSNSVVC